MSKKSMSVAEEYAIALECAEPTYYAQIPATLYRCTFLAPCKKNPDQQVRYKLKPIAIALYGALKQIAGQKSRKVWMASTGLAELVGCSAGALSEAKKALSQPMEQLGGKSLITIKSKTRRHDKGAFTYHEITINNVWPENNAYMETLKSQPGYPLGPVATGSISYNETESGSLSQYEREPPGSVSYYETNNRKQKKTPPVKETDASAKRSVCDPKPKEESVTDPLELDEQRKRAEKSLRDFGCDDNFVTEMLRKFYLEPARILKAGWYTVQQKKRGKIRSNKFGYLRNAIERGLAWEVRQDVS